MRDPMYQDLGHVLAHTESVWDSLRHSRLFLTGGTGFFGCWLLESFVHACRELDLRSEIVVLTRNAAAFRAKAPHLAGDRAVTLHEGDVRDFAFPGGEFTHVIHAATETDAKRNAEDPLALTATVLDGTRRVLGFAAERRVRSLLLTSSGAVYGPQPPDVERVPETFGGGPDPTQARWTYGESKRMSELLCCLYGERYGFPVKIARCFAFVGPYLRLDAHFAVGNFIGDVLAGRDIEIRGDGTAVRSYLYAADLAAWLWTMLVQAPAFRPYNVGSGEALTIAEIAQTVVRSLGSAAAIRILGRPDPARPVDRYVPDVGRAASELGLAPAVSVEEGIRRTAAWHKSLEVTVH